MQSFYLTNTNKDHNFEKFNSFLNLYQEIKINEKIKLFLFNSKNKESFLQKDKSFLCNLGVFIYKKHFNSDALKLFISDLEKGNKLDDMLTSDHTRGQFLLIIYFNNKLTLITDRLGYYPVYIYQNNNDFSFSNSMLTISSNNKLKLNKVGVAEYLSENYKYITYACCDQNLFENINYLKPGTKYTIENNKVDNQEYFHLKKYLKIGKYNNFDELVHLAEKYFIDNLSFLENYKNYVSSDITGGVDTRLVLATLQKIGIKPQVGLQAVKEYSDFSNTGKFSEINIVNQIVNHYDLNLNLFSENEYSKNRDKIEDLSLFLSHKQTYNRRTGYFMSMRNLDTKILTSGLSGTEQLRLSYYNYFKKNKKLNLNTFLREHVELVDILKDNFLSQNQYYDHLNKFYKNNLQDLNYQHDRDLSAYIDYFAFYRTHFSKYLSLANSFMPFYTPYGDFKFAKLMYETSYDLKKKFKIQRYLISKFDKKLASLYCTRGFPLDLVSIGNFFKYSRMIKNDIPQQYFNINEKLKNFYYKKLIKLSFANKWFYKKIFDQKTYIEETKQKNLWNLPNQLSIVFDLESFLKKDLPVFEFIDKKKLAYYVKKDCNYNVLNRVINLNKILKISKF